jgi:hypothetical protein
MSQQTTENPAELEQRQQEAYTLGMQELWHPVFFTKLATYGWQPQSEAEALKVIEIGGKLQALEAQQQVKQASSQYDWLCQADQVLDQHLGQYAPPAPPVSGGTIKLASELLRGNEKLQQALALLAGSPAPAA